LAQEESTKMKGSGAFGWDVSFYSVITEGKPVYLNGDGNH
jgi:hypothetical protein